MRLATVLPRLCVGLLLVGFARPLLAGDDNANFNQFRPSITARGTFGVESASVLGHLNYRAGAWFHYAKDALQLPERYKTPEAREAISDLLILDVVAGLGLFDRLELGLDLPIALYVAGSGRGDGSVMPREALGDLRFVPRVRILGDRCSIFRLAAGAELNFPTGDGGAFLSTEQFSGGFSVTAGVHVPYVDIDANLGLRFGPTRSVRNLTTDHQLYGALGVSVQLWSDRLYALVEAQTATRLADPFGNKFTTPVELLLGLRGYPVKGLALFLGAGPGLGEAMGTPDARVVFGATWAPE